MIINGTNLIRNVKGITDIEERMILDFLQGSVYSWCKNKRDEWFALRDLMGGDNFFWTGTPLQILFVKHEISKNNSELSIKGAAKDAGWLLKKVLKIDKREFETKKEAQTRQYKWTGKE